MSNEIEIKDFSYKLYGAKKDGGLISGRDAWLANFDGKDVEYRHRDFLKGEWQDFAGEIWDKEELTSGFYIFRVKPTKPVITMLNKDWSVTYSFHDQDARKEFMDKVEGYLNV